MTRLAVLSDIHGNLPALEAVAQDLAAFQPDQVVVAGDVINWGPFSAEVLELVAARGWPAVRGNNEYYLLDYGTPRAPAEWNDLRQYPLLPWLGAQLNDPWRARIAAWPDTLSLRFPDAPPVLVVHGSPRSCLESMFPTLAAAEAERFMAGVQETTVIAGHTHLSMDVHVGRWHLLNPGSVGLPLDGRLSASYMLLDGGPDGWRPHFRRVPFDYDPVFREFERQQFEAQCGLVGRLVVEEFRRGRLELLPFLNWRRACCPGAPLELPLLDAYAGVDRQAYLPPEYRAFELAGGAP